MIQTEKIIGNISAIDKNKYIVKGWVISKNTPLDKLEVQLKTDDKIIVNNFANKYTKELSENSIGDGKYGFELKIPTSINKQINFKVIVVSTGDIIGNFKLPSYEDYHLLKSCTLFDSAFYLKQNNDVKDMNFEPIDHFLLYGYRDGRNPSQNFDTNLYTKTYPEVLEQNINPLIHYIKIGKNKNYKIFNQEIKELKLNKLTKMFDYEINIPDLELKEPIDILVPIYNGFDYLTPLLESIIKNTTLPFRLLLCDDKSTDKRVFPLLRKYQNRYKNLTILIFENKKNKGFIKTVNKLVKHTQNHFVLLNTDTEVPLKWLERLMYPIFKMKNIASTTPFTNAGTICSFPNYLQDNKILEGMDVNELDKYFRYINYKNTNIDIPTGVGFCMGVNKSIVKQIGMFDTIFGKGYAEENDWCQRAIKKGYKNIHVTNLFVYHKHGGSFESEEKQELLSKNLKILNKKHPTFDKQVENTIQENKLRTLRDILYFKILSKNKFTTLVFDHELGGGTNYYIDMKIKNKLKKDEIVLLVRYDYYRSKNFIFKFISSNKEFLFFNNDIKQIFYILKFFKFDEIFVNSFVSYPKLKSFIKLCKKLKTKKTKLTIPIHDYFSICPNYTLLDHTMNYCQVPTNHKKCSICLKKSTNEFGISIEKDIQKWRNFWDEILKSSDNIICFSNASKEIFLKVYLEYKSKVHVIPHNISEMYQNVYDFKQIKAKKNVIGILGAIDTAKGLDIIKNLLNHMKKNKLNAKIVLIGYMSDPIDESKFFHCTGKYEKKNLPLIVKKKKITQFLIPSIWPETFSYTTEEIMQLGYPLTVFDLGAPAERVKKYKYGKVIKQENLYDELFFN